MNKNERLDLLDQAWSKMYEALSLVQEALEGTEHEDIEDFTKKVQNLCDSNNVFEMGIQQYMDALIDEEVARK